MLAGISGDIHRKGKTNPHLNTVQGFYDVVLAEQFMAKAEKSLERSREHLNSAVSLWFFLRSVSWLRHLLQY